MSKSLRNILISLVVFIMITIITILPSMSTIIEILSKGKNTIELKSKNSIVKFNENGKVEITDSIKIEVQKNPNEYLAIPLTLYEVDEDNIRQSLWPQIESVTIDEKFIFGKYSSIMNIEKNETIYYYYGGSAGECISIRNANLITPGMHTIKIKYTYEEADLVKQYNDFTIFKIQNNQKIGKLHIYIILPNKAEVFELKNKKAIITNTDKVAYSIDMSNAKKH